VIPSDWVKIRHQCSLPEVFELLRGQVQADTEQRKSLVDPQTTGFSFVFSGESNWFAVAKTGNARNKRVRFVLQDYEIKVENFGAREK